MASANGRIARLDGFFEALRVRPCALTICLVVSPGNALAPASAGEDPCSGAQCRLAFQAILKREAQRTGLPFEIGDAVVAVESSYNPQRVGALGEIGLMQVLPSTAAMLGFKGTPRELAAPEINIHLGTTYLAEAWRRAGGDFCRTLMKYRAGHGEEVMSARSTAYCDRARLYLTTGGTSLPLTQMPMPMLTKLAPQRHDLDRKSCLSHIPKLNVRLRGAVFWAAHDLRVKAITSCIRLPLLLANSHPRLGG